MWEHRRIGQCWWGPLRFRQNSFSGFVVGFFNPFQLDEVKRLPFPLRFRHMHDKSRYLLGQINNIHSIATYTILLSLLWPCLIKCPLTWRNKLYRTQLSLTYHTCDLKASFLCHVMFKVLVLSKTVHMCGYWKIDLCYLQYQSPKNGHVVHYP